MATDDDILKIARKHKLSAPELERVLSSVENQAPQVRHSFEDYFESKTKIGVFADAHIGVREFDEPLFRHMAKMFQRRDVTRIYQVGDILEGMSGRDGHIYELTHVGFEQQIEKAAELFDMFKGIDTYGIDGNHDLWYQQKGNIGMIVGKEMEKRVSHYHHLGQMEANIKIRDNITMRLFHPNDGTAYAVSYKIQKLAESLEGGKKPEILLEGHYHKALYMFLRNIHLMECGTLCGQTQWMRGKKIAAAKGFWIIDMEIGRGGIGMFAPQFYPGYK